MRPRLSIAARLVCAAALAAGDAAAASCWPPTGRRAPPSPAPPRPPSPLPPGTRSSRASTAPSCTFPMSRRRSRACRRRSQKMPLDTDLSDAARPDGRRHADHRGRPQGTSRPGPRGAAAAEALRGSPDPGSLSRAARSRTPRPKTSSKRAIRQFVKEQAAARRGACPPHPGQDRGRGEVDHRRAQQGGRFRRARQEIFDRSRRATSGGDLGYFGQGRYGPGVRRRRLCA